MKVMNWDYEGYWNTVLGASRDAAGIVTEFDLNTKDRVGLSTWLGCAEAAACVADNIELPEEWEAFHGRALDELCNVTGENS